MVADYQAALRIGHCTPLQTTSRTVPFHLGVLALAALGSATLHVHPLCLPSQGGTGPASMGLGCSLPLSLPVLNLQFLYSHFTFPEHYYSTGQGAGNTILALQFY